MNKKPIAFKDIPLKGYFKYQGQLFFKNGEDTGIKQSNPIKHRAVVEFGKTCPVQEGE